MKRIDQLIRHREALAAEWRTNHADRARIEIELDRTTTLLADLTGLGVPLLEMPTMLAGGLGFGRRKRRRIIP
jgi:hypothetical protein